MRSKLVSLLLLFSTACFLIKAQTGSSQSKVLIIGIDGVRPDALSVANTPHLDALAANGIFSPDALNDDITYSGPGWSAMTTGVWSDKHGVTNNLFFGSNYDAFPHIFKRINDYDSDLYTASICHWDPINDLIVLDHADFKLNVGTDLDVANNAGTALANDDLDVLFLHFDDVDGAGHGNEFSPDNAAYISAIEQTDVYVGQVVAAVQARANYADENWLILSSTDHGGIGSSHGGTTIQEERIFFIASGNGIDQRLIQRDSFLVANPLPFNCLGDTLETQFDGSGDYVTIYNDNGEFDFGTTTDFTIECRVRTTTAADVSIIGNKDWNSGGNAGFVFSFAYPAGPEWKVNIGDGNNRVDLNNGGAIADGEWHTLSVSFDRDGMMKQYEDGQLIDQADISSIGSINTPFDLMIGADGNFAYEYTGAIAEVRVWLGVIGGTEISDWACQPLSNQHPNWSDLLGYWKLDESSGSTAFDASGNNHDGTAFGVSRAIPDSFRVEYNYDNTPRIVDVPVTALDFLCIPLDAQLDGRSWVENCDPVPSVHAEISEQSELRLEIHGAQLHVEMPQSLKNARYQIVDLSGRLKQSGRLEQADGLIELNSIDPGLYLFKVTKKQRSLVKKFRF